MGLDLQVYQGCIHNNVGVAHSVLVQETYTDNEIDVSTIKSMRSSKLSKHLHQYTKLGINIYSCTSSGLTDHRKNQNYTPAAQSNRYEITFIYNGLHGGCRIMRIIEPFG